MILSKVRHVVSRLTGIVRPRTVSKYDQREFGWIGSLHLNNRTLVRLHLLEKRFKTDHDDTQTTANFCLQSGGWGQRWLVSPGPSCLSRDISTFSTCPHSSWYRPRTNDSLIRNSRSIICSKRAAPTYFASYFAQHFSHSKFFFYLNQLLKCSTNKGNIKEFPRLQIKQSE